MFQHVADLEGLVQISHGRAEPPHGRSSRGQRGAAVGITQHGSDALDSAAAAQPPGPASAGPPERGAVPGGAHAGTAPAANRCTQHLAQRAGETRRENVFGNNKTINKGAGKAERPGIWVMAWMCLHSPGSAGQASKIFP